MAETAAPSAQPAVGLVLRTSERAIDVVAEPVFIGRDPACHLSIRSSRASRFHASVFRFGSSYVVRDLGSTNGTQLNEAPVVQSPLRPGDRLRIGDDVIEVRASTSAVPPYSDELAVLFLDIADFTRMAEKHGKPFLDLLSKAFNELTLEILKRRGLLIKTMGDGLMATFGMWRTGDRRYSPADAALGFAVTASRLIERLTVGAEHLHCRVGIAFGPAVVRDENALDVLGDTVNLAARLESLNKHYGTSVMLTEGIKQRLGQKHDALRELDTIRVVGREEPVTVYIHDALDAKLGQDETSPKGMPTLDAPSVASLYAAGLRAYRAGDFAGARAAFEQGEKRGDRPCGALAKRVAGTPPQGWAGVWTFEAK